jgi:hypothetical protein
MDNKLEIDWAAVVDVLASEYGWTIEYIGTLDLSQVMSLIKVIKARNARQNGDTVEAHDDTESEEQMSASSFKSMFGGKIVKNDDGSETIIV